MACWPARLWRTLPSRPTRSGQRPLARRSSTRGPYFRANRAVLYRQSGTLTSRPRRRSRSPSRTRSSAESQSHFGILPALIPARWWNSVRVYPAQSAITRTPRRRTASPTDSLKLVTHALLAEYVEPGMTRKDAMDETLITSPRPRSTIPGSAARVSRSTAVTLSASNRSRSSALACRNDLFSPMPALLTSSSTGSVGSARRSSTAARPSGVVRSAGSGIAVTPCAPASSSPCLARRAASRATSTRSWPSAASARANAAPMPAVAPVIKAVLTGYLRGFGCAAPARAAPRRGSPGAGSTGFYAGGCPSAGGLGRSGSPGGCGAGGSAPSGSAGGGIVVGGSAAGGSAAGGAGGDGRVAAPERERAEAAEAEDDQPVEHPADDPGDVGSAQVQQAEHDLAD